jgi:hypothetical protein
MSYAMGILNIFGMQCIISPLHTSKPHFTHQKIDVVDFIKKDSLVFLD